MKLASIALEEEKGPGRPAGLRIEALDSIKPSPFLLVFFSITTATTGNRRTKTNWQVSFTTRIYIRVGQNYTSKGVPLVRKGAFPLSTSSLWLLDPCVYIDRHFPLQSIDSKWIIFVPNFDKFFFWSKINIRTLKGQANDTHTAGLVNIQTAHVLPRR